MAGLDASKVFPNAVELSLAPVHKEPTKAVEPRGKANKPPINDKQNSAAKTRPAAAKDKPKAVPDLSKAPDEAKGEKEANAMARASEATGGVRKPLLSGHCLLTVQIASINGVSAFPLRDNGHGYCRICPRLHRATGSHHTD